MPYVMANTTATTPTKVIKHMLMRIMSQTHGLDPGEDISDGIIGGE